MIGRFGFLARNNSKCLSAYGQMPKRKFEKPNNGKKEEQPAKDDPVGPVTLDKAGNISIKILAKPGAKANNVTGIGSDAVGVQINAPPVEGEANTELVKYLASVFGLRKSDVTLDKGSKSRQKTIVIHSGTLSVDQVIEKLKSAMEKN